MGRRGNGWREGVEVCEGKVGTNLEGREGNMGEGRTYVSEGMMKGKGVVRL